MLTWSYLPGPTRIPVGAVLQLELLETVDAGVSIGDSEVVQHPPDLALGVRHEILVPDGDHSGLVLAVGVDQVLQPAEQVGGVRVEVPATAGERLHHRRRDGERVAPEEDELALGEELQEIAYDVVVPRSLVQEVDLPRRCLGVQTEREVVHALQVARLAVGQVLAREAQGASRHRLVLVLGMDAQLAERVQLREEEPGLGGRADLVVRSEDALEERRAGSRQREDERGAHQPGSVTHRHAVRRRSTPTI